jgi:chromosomal replication initiation ATPase DnaA
VSAQLPLDLAQRPALERGDFLVAAANREAVAWIDRWPGWPSRGLAVHGPAASGKSHLVQVFAAKSGAWITQAATLTRDDPPRLSQAPALAIEDIENLADERALLHLLNMAAEASCLVLLTAKSAPARWRVALPDLRSRLLALQAAEIQPPDDSLLAAVLMKMFADRQIRVGAEAIEFALGRIERSFEAARRLAETADALALARKRNVTVPLLREALEAMEGRETP